MSRMSLLPGGSKPIENRIRIRRKGGLAETLPKAPEVQIDLVEEVAVQRVADIADPQKDLNRHQGTKEATQVRIKKGEVGPRLQKDLEVAKVLEARVPLVT